MYKGLLKDTWSQLRTLGIVFMHGFRKRETLNYPEEEVYLSPRYRGRIVLTRDPDGEERCVACNLCAVACPVACISLQKAEREDGDRKSTRLNSSHVRISYAVFCLKKKSRAILHAPEETIDVFDEAHHLADSKCG